MTTAQRPTTRAGRANHTGRGRDWGRKILTKRKAKRIARYNAGMIISAVLGDGWEPQHLITRYGEDGLAAIIDAMMDLGLWLRDTGHPDGVAHDYEKS